MITVHATITGRVQGVGYRAWTLDEARRLDVKGWVRNRSDRSVEAVFQGDETMVATLLEKCWQGPLMARVMGVRQKSHRGNDVFDKFTSKPTL